MVQRMVSATPPVCTPVCIPVCSVHCCAWSSGPVVQGRGYYQCGCYVGRTWDLSGGARVWGEGVCLIAAPLACSPCSVASSSAACAALALEGPGVAAVVALSEGAGAQGGHGQGLLWRGRGRTRVWPSAPRPSPHRQSPLRLHLLVVVVAQSLRWLDLGPPASRPQVHAPKLDPQAASS